MSYLQLFVRLSRFFLFWLLLAMLDRVVFLSFFAAKHSETGFPQYLMACLHGFRMDLSMAAYISLLPFLVFVIRLFVPRLRIPSLFLRLYTFLIITIYLIVSVANLFLYMEWSEKISLKAVDMFITSPKEALASLPVYQLLFLLLLGILLIWGLMRLSGKIIGYSQALPMSRTRFSGRAGGLRRGFSHWVMRPVASLFFVLLLAFLLFSCIRGGYGRAPMNPSMVYFSSVPFLNHAAVNTHWYLLDDVLKHKSTKHPFLYMDEAEVSSIIDDLYNHFDQIQADADTTIGRNPATDQNLFINENPIPMVLVSDGPPNVVLIILEGFTAELVESLGGESGIAPGLEKLIGEGLLFDRIYSVAERSDKGIVGLLSGFPAQATQSVIRSVNKLEKLPVIAGEFRQAGYGTSFYYGGQSAFYNLKSYVLMNGYDVLSDLDTFGDVSRKSSWGIFDEDLFDRHLHDLGSMQQPFFSTIYTLTNHHPFELPGASRFGRNGMGNQFRSTAFYTDSVLYDYLEKARTQSWYPNTLFVIVADHGHRLPEDRWEIYQHQRHHIPLLFFGQVLREEYRGRRVSRIGSQTDLARTLLRQTGLSAARYHWSHDLLDSRQPALAFYNWQTGFGLLTDEGAVSYDFVGNHLITAEPADMPPATQNRLLQQARAIMQQVYTNYLGY